MRNGIRTESIISGRQLENFCALVGHCRTRRTLEDWNHDCLLADFATLWHLHASLDSIHDFLKEINVLTSCGWLNVGDIYTFTYIIFLRCRLAEISLPILFVVFCFGLIWFGLVVVVLGGGCLLLTWCVSPWYDLRSWPGAKNLLYIYLPYVVLISQRHRLSLTCGSRTSSSCQIAPSEIEPVSV